MTSGWTTVFYGSPARALIIQSKLEAHEIPTQLPGQRVREMDPFITGAGPLSQAVEVPNAAAELASDVIAAAPSPDDFDTLPEPAAEDLELARLAGLGHNMRWAAVFSLIVPVVPSLFGLYLGWRYFVGKRALGKAPSGDRWNVLAFIACAVLLPARLLTIYIQ